MATKDARRFTSTLFMLFGPLFVAGGFLAAFTLDGAIYVFFGLGMLLSGILLRTRIPLWAAFAAGCLVFLALTLDMVRG